MQHASWLLGAGLIGAVAVLLSRRAAGWLRQAAAWLLIFIALVGAYAFRFEARMVLTRITGELAPASVDDDGSGNVTVRRSDDGHFYIDGAVNGSMTRMMLDTGASRVVLSPADARRAGIDVASLSFTNPVVTANGEALTAPVMLERLSVGSIARTRVPAWVTREGTLDESLLGLSFIDRLGGIAIAGDRLTLHDR